MDLSQALVVPTWFQVVSIGVNISILLVIIKLTRQFSRVELKVETMWKHFILGVERRNRVRSEDE